MMFDYRISAQLILFLILYGVTGAMSLFAAIYLMMRKGNAFAADVTPPVRLRRWASSFYGVSVLGHVWWILYYIFSTHLISIDYVILVVLDCLTLQTTISGTLLAMLQDRQRPIWPIFVAMIPFTVLGCMLIIWPSSQLRLIATYYMLALYTIFTCYMAFAVRQYGRWLRDNYADLERKEVWQTQLMSLLLMLLYIFYLFVTNNITLFIVMHLIELVIFIILLWRVETLPQLGNISTEGACTEPDPQVDVQETTTQAQQQVAISSNISPQTIERLLTEHCVNTQLYLHHDLTLLQLARAIGTNRYYLSQYFSLQGITYNTYINDLRINHFVSRYHEVANSQQPFTVQKLASESGYRSYSTFSLAFKQRIGKSVTAWMRNMK